MSKTIPTLLVGLLASAAVGLLIYFYGPSMLHGLWVFGRIWWPIIVFSAIMLFVGFVVSDEGDNGGPAVVVGIVAILAIVAFFLFGNYVKNTKYAESLDVHENVSSHDKQVSFSDRAPFDVANETSNRTLGDTTGDSTGLVKSLPMDAEHGLYSTSVVRRGIAQGYESTQILNAPVFGTAGNANVKFCDFNQANARLRLGGGFPVNNLKRAIYAKTTPSVALDNGDVFATCEGDKGDTPMVYAPLTKLKGVFYPYRVPAGVAIYNGSTGELRIEKDYKGNKPVYPKSLATHQRNSTQATEGYINYLFNRTGFEDTSKDADDPNGDNRAEFNMASADRTSSSLVTPLTSRGSSSSIVALGTVESNHVKDGELNKYTVNRFADGASRQANSAVASRIMSEQLSGYKGQGLQVFEVVPQKDGNWVASIGKTQSILYRAVIDDQGVIKLYDQHNNPVNDAAKSDGDGNESKEKEPKDENKKSGTTSKPIDQMSEDELRELGNQIVDELAHRASQGSVEEQK